LVRKCKFYWKFRYLKIRENIQKRPVFYPFNPEMPYPLPVSFRVRMITGPGIFYLIYLILSNPGPGNRHRIAPINLIAGKETGSSRPER
jgi:hypothetical protein